MNETSATSLKENILHALHEVKDPEIPVISVVDLGIIIDVQIDEEHNVLIKMTPTFSGCPALQIMQLRVQKRASEVEGVNNVKVEVDEETSWSSNRISDEGRKQIKEFGLAPPPKFQDELDVSTIEDVQCPYCDSTNNQLKTPFGSTLCRAIHYCNNCKQTFEQFKPL